MNQEALRQVAEIAKNLSITFDGKLNSETVVQAIKEIMPYFYLVQIKEFVGTCIWATAVVVSACIIGKTVMKVIKTQQGEV